MSPADSDRMSLDRNYNLRAAVPEFQTWFDRYEATSAAFRARWPGRLDLRYGDGPRQAVDLFLPARATAAPPLLVFIHGGYWQSRDRKDFSYVAEPLVAAGAAVALLGYDLAPALSMEAIVAQIRDGMTWLHRQAGEHGFDRNRIVLAGHSAGGHLAAMALATDWRGFGLPADLIKGVTAISGVFDLEPVRRCYLNDVLGMDQAQARRNSPLALALPGPPCPVLVTVGGRETAAFHEQSRAYAAKLEAAGWPCELATAPDLDHFAIVMTLAEPGTPIVRALARQLGLEGPCA